MKGEECMLSERIKELRLSRNLNQVQLGEALWVTKQTISNWENDNITINCNADKDSKVF